MKKNFLITFLCLGFLSSAQFKDNAFDNESSKLNQDKVQDLNMAEANQNATFEEEQGSTVSAGPVGGEQPEGPGNPGIPVPISGLVPVLLISGLILIFYYQRKSKKINI